MNKYIQDKLLEKHICRFNDGECNCDCYIAGITDYHNHIVEKIEEWFEDRGTNMNFDILLSILQDTNPKE